jgi:hypothetical protein
VWQPSDKLSSKATKSRHVLLLLLLLLLHMGGHELGVRGTAILVTSTQWSGTKIVLKQKRFKITFSPLALMVSFIIYQLAPEVKNMMRFSTCIIKPKRRRRRRRLLFFQPVPENY